MNKPADSSELNRWVRVEAAFFADSRRANATLRQAWRWSAPFREWLEREDLAANRVSEGDVERFLREMTPAAGTKNRDQRKWAIGLLLEAAATVAPPLAKRANTYRARLDAVPERSPLGKAIARVLAGAKTPADRARMPTALGRFLRWCDERGLDPDDLWPGDIDAFRRDYVAAGGSSPGESGRLARRLLRELQLV